MNQNHFSLKASPQRAGLAATKSKERILVVDDIEDNLFLVNASLEDKYELLLASSGMQALAIIMSQTPPDLILLDVMMPDMDGYEVLRRVRQHPPTATTPVIFLTSLSSMEKQEFGLGLGAMDYITKPFSPTLLLARVQSHLELSSNARRFQTLSDKLSCYLAPQIYKSLFDDSKQNETRTEPKKLTVFCSAIKDFTASTANWHPEEISRFLNSYYSEMSCVAAEYDGTVDRFTDDSMLIFFGDPKSLGEREDAVEAVNMAIAMQRAMTELQALWRDSGPGKTLGMRIGINTGFCDVGNFGSELLMDYVITGPEVNLASQLEQAADPGGILLSGETYALVRGEIEGDQCMEITAKGIANPVTAYAVRIAPRIKKHVYSRVEAITAYAGFHGWKNA